MFSLDAPISGGSNLGLVYAYDKIGSTYTHSIMADYAYRLKVGQTSRLSFGLSAGMVNYGVDKQELMGNGGDPGDPLVDNSENKWKPTIDFGIYFDTKYFYAGFSIVGILANKRDENTFQIIRTDANYFLHLGGAIPLSEKWKLLPSTLVKSDFSNPLCIDINAMVMYNDRFALGCSYRTGILWFTDVADNTYQRDAISLIAEAYITDRIRLGAAYDFDMNKVTKGSTFEISLGYYLTKPKTKFVTPRYF
jgi:type IX secretion system PorP/SprF family membrane protein